MITSHDILDKIGLKSAKTLTRWHQRGLIPEPLVRTHPSGRGKVAYWPDWVLDRCRRIVELQREGHSLQSVARLLEVERWNRTLEYVESQPESISEVLADRKLQLAPGREGTMLDAFRLAMLASVSPVVRDPTERRALLSRISEEKAVDRAWILARGGYNPVLLYDGHDLEVVPDFLVAQRLSSEDLPPRKAFVVAPILPTLCEAFPAFGKVLGTAPRAWPAPKVWVQEGDAVVEYVYYPAGVIGFELIRETAKVVSTVPNQAGSDAVAGSENG